MPRTSRIFLALCMLTPLLLASGCLSLGTRTTYVQETQESKDRMADLEKRISVLEQMLLREGASVSSYETPAP